MKYGYARGTSEQIESQIRKLISAGVQTVFCDCGQQPAKGRMGYHSLMGAAKRGDTIVVTELIRLTRNCLTVLKLEEEGIMINSLTDDQNSSAILQELIKSFLKNGLL